MSTVQALRLLADTASRRCADRVGRGTVAGVPALVAGRGPAFVRVAEETDGALALADASTGGALAILAAADPRLAGRVRLVSVKPRMGPGLARFVRFTDRMLLGEPALAS